MLIVMALTVSGRVIDSESGRPMAYAVVILHNPKDTSKLTGTYTDEKGVFVLKNVKAGRYLISADFIGYRKTFVGPVEIERDTNIGTIALSPQPIRTEEVVVEATPSKVRYEVDRKVITPSADIVSRGGSASDVLRSVPGVDVDMQGNVKIRGSSNYILFVDGHPTNLSLKDIPASQIERIEVITNPSAEYDAEGNAIINVVLKKRRSSGYSLSADVTGNNHGTLKGNLAAYLSLDKVSYFVKFSAQKNSTKFKREEVMVYEGDTLKVRGIWDQCSRILRLSAGFQTEATQLEVGGAFNEYGVTIPTVREGINEGNFYEHSLERKPRGFLSFTHTRNVLSGLLNLEIYASYYPRSISYLVDTTTGYGIKTVGYEESYRGYLSLKYSLKNLKLGIKVYPSRGSRLDTTKALGSISYPDIPPQTLKYRRDIHSAFLLYTSEVGRFNYSLGLRAEYTDRSMNTIKINRLDLFPSLNVSTSFAGSQIYAAFSRRIWRPPYYMIYPMYVVQTTYLVQLGNPNLLPEYYYKAQLGAMRAFGPVSLSAEAYYDATENVQDVRESKFEGYDVTLYRFVSSKGYGRKYGIDLSLQAFLMGFVGVMGGVSPMRYEYEDVSSDYLSAYAVLSLNLSSVQLQVRYGYSGAYRLVWGSVAPYHYLDIGANFSIRGFNVYAGITDPVPLFKEDLTVTGENFYRHATTQYAKPVITLSLSYSYSRNFKRTKVKEIEELESEEEQKFLLK